MIEIFGKTIAQVFDEAVSKWSDHSFLCSPATSEKSLVELSYGSVSSLVESWVIKLQQSGYGYGQRVGLLLGNNADHYIFKLALNYIGISCVPINPDYTKPEIIYLLEDSKADLIITNKKFEKIVKVSAKLSKTEPAVFVQDAGPNDIPLSKNAPRKIEIGLNTEASLIYTSGTTGKPKGCILSHEYELLCGDVYPKIRNPVQLQENKDRIFNPLPSFHINAGVVTFFGTMLSGNCMIQPSRFHASSWWDELYETKATIFHYLGVVIAVLLSERNIDPEKLRYLRVGLGAGVEPALHVEFEKRLNIPLVELWGMTEMCRILVADQEPRMINTRAVGKPQTGIEVRVVNEKDEDVEINQTGQMILRHSEGTPRYGFFSGYLNKVKETEESWKGGWFHTGDTVRMDENGMIYFVDRSKNIIRRSGENIAAAEIEDKLSKSELISTVACLAVNDEIREEEVMSCIVLKSGVPKSAETASEIFNEVSSDLAYFKLPGWILFLEYLPVTGTQKIAKHEIFGDGVDPRNLPDIFDFRCKKKSKNH